ncbi:hypothetical protein C8Q75DRAFT_869757 [Abortiporus biennis]|nr:hypothetical protein C8Q75DRAFT_869757 [Abortiporus biennis]
MSTCNIRQPQFSSQALPQLYARILNVLNESGYLSQMRVSMVIRPKLPQLSVAPYFGKYSEIKNASTYPGTCIEPCIGSRTEQMSVFDDGNSSNIRILVSICTWNCFMLGGS